MNVKLAPLDTQVIQPPKAEKVFDPTAHTVRPCAQLMPVKTEVKRRYIKPYVGVDAVGPRPTGPKPVNQPPPQTIQHITEDVFWQIIDNVHWRNKDDGGAGSVSHIKKLHPNSFNQFVDHYERIYDGLKTVIDAARILEVRGITNPLEIRKIVSHIIGLGHATYMTILTGEMTFLEYFIDADQCVSLDALI